MSGNSCINYNLKISSDINNISRRNKYNKIKEKQAHLNTFIEANFYNINNERTQCTEQNMLLYPN